MWRNFGGFAALLSLLVGAGTAAAQPPKGASGSWTLFTDPNEHAFSLEVPAGWKIEGGMVRRGPVDLSMFLRALSPDDAVMLILGDPAPAYFGETGLGAGPKARPYLPGGQYARQYAQQTLPSLCSGLTFEKGSDRPDIANGKIGQMTPYAEHNAGDAVFTCTRNGRPMKAYLVALTFRYPAVIRTMPGSWGVGLLAGCIAPADRVVDATKLIVHMLETAHLDPQWSQQQQARVNMATHNINAISAAEQQAFDASLAHAKAQQAAMRDEYNRFDETLTQTGTFRDSSGNVYHLQNTQNYHWLGVGGQTAETSTATPPPGGGWTLLQQIHPSQ
jgi:predicted lactoylglutathione lyase